VGAVGFGIQTRCGWSESRFGCGCKPETGCGFGPL